MATLTTVLMEQEKGILTIAEDNSVRSFRAVSYTHLDVYKRQVIMSIDQIRGNVYVKPILEALHLSSDTQIIIFICTGVALIYIFKNAFAIFYTWVSTKFANKIRRELALRIFNAYVRQGYTYFVEHNSSEILRGIGVDPQSVQTIVFNIFILMIRIITVVCITVFIVLTSPWLALMLLIMIALSSLRCV